MFLISAFIIGILGSFHCIGMCGPIALSLPVHHYKAFKKNLGIFLYNLGRIITYFFIGLIFGSLGRSFSLIGLQQALSITLGILLLLSVLFSRNTGLTILKLPFITRAVNQLKVRLKGLFAKKGLRFLFGIGLLNGLLPCGLVYLGVAGAIASQNSITGGLFMLSFGLGTIPVMHSLGIIGQFITLRFRNRTRRVMPYAISVMALLLILRGSNLGIPYVSPAFDAKTKMASCCLTHADKK